MGRIVRISDFSDRMMAELAKGRLESDEVRPQTINRDLRHIQAVWRFAFHAGDVDKLPRFRKLKETKKIPNAWTVEEIGRLLRAAESASGWVQCESFSIPASKWWPAAILFAYDTGIRRSALTKVRTADVDIRLRTALIRGETRKDAEDLLVGFSVQTAVELEKIWDVHRELLLPWPYTWPHLTRKFRRLLDRAGLYDPSIRGQWHRIRRSRASYGEAVCPGSATADLGHSVRWLTERSYIDPRIAGRASIVDKLPRPL
ncbi:tyrosine-type recombinase/integrase [Kolteria novifilia]|uniref:tyrosine-type recombinase/integrase n=1 Tax=Kolteria novifilia TaxID=2527975 RepID=UPI003AF3D87D